MYTYIHTYIGIFACIVCMCVCILLLYTTKAPKLP